jgi:hypothetical protein
MDLLALQQHPFSFKKIFQCWTHKLAILIFFITFLETQTNNSFKTGLTHLQTKISFKNWVAMQTFSLDYTLNVTQPTRKS